MADQAADTGVLDQDDPPTDPSGAAHESVPDPDEETSNGRPSGEPTSETGPPGPGEAAEAPESAEPAAERGEQAEPEASDERDEQAEPDAPETPQEQGQQAEPEEPEASNESDDQAEPEGLEASDKRDDQAEPEGSGTPQDPDNQAEPDAPETPQEQGEQAESEEPEASDEPDDQAEANGSGTPQDPDNQAEPDAPETPQERDEQAESEQPEASQERDDQPETEAPEAPEARDAETESDRRETPEEAQEPGRSEGAGEEPAEKPGALKDAADGGSAEGADEADAGADRDEAPAQDAEPLSEEDPDEDAEAAPEGDGAAPDKNAEAAPEDDEDDGAAADGTAAASEAAAPEASESTRTVALRTLEDAAAGVDKTMAIDVADLPAVEPSAPSPLDLLAQLTNTPPPPATPARTILRRVKIWSPLVALLALVVLVVQLVRPLPEPVLALDAGASSFTIGGGTFTMPWPEEGQAAVMIAGSGTIGTFGKQKPVPTASVAKIMTAYVILRDHPIERDEPGPSVTVDARTVEEGKAKDESRIEGLKAGQTFSLQDMLKMLMIPSGNNVARLLARWDTKTDDETAFVRKMNAAAKSLGMKNTTYTDPSGLDKGTVSTAVDQLKLAEAVMKFESFRAVVALPDAEIPGATRIFNNNSLLGVAGLSVRGIKTGSNTPAGGTLSWAAYKTVDGEDRLVLGTMMDQHVTGPDPNGSNSLQLVLDNSEKVIKAVRDALTSATAVKKGQVVGHIDDGLGGRTPVVATKDVQVVGVPGQRLKLTFRDGDASLAGGAKAGTVVGELTVGSGAGARHVPLALRSDLREPSVGAKLTRIG
ncbi:serine hydrolase [Streptomyces sp. NPDC049627]|uniref:D-alanyl-D-alanine carboxypeptidase n=1 Tax=Streptomyces sp. NPDC049627 TaxID=3365595 RepID=UPI00379CD6B4